MRENIIRFEGYELDSNGCVRPSAIMRRMQQCAMEDLLSYGITDSSMRANNMAFVVSRMALRFDKPIASGKELRLRTSANPTRGVTFPRSFEIKEGDETVFRCYSLWALLDLEKRMILRPSALKDEFGVSEVLCGELSCERLLRPKEQAPVYTDTRKVYASLLDQNKHLNNCNYADIALDLLPPDVTGIREIQIAFQHEAYLGEELLMEGWQNETGYLVSGAFAHREENCFLCQIKI